MRKSLWRARGRCAFRHVAVETIDKDGAVLRESVNQFFRRQRPTLVIPVAARYPAAFRKIRCEATYAPGELLRRRGVAQINARELEAAGEEMHVRVVKAGKDERVFGIYDSRSHPREPLYLIRRSYCDDAVAVDGKALRARLPGVHRADVGVDDDEVGLKLLRARLRLRQGRRETCEKDEGNRCSHL